MAFLSLSLGSCEPWHTIRIAQAGKVKSSCAGSVNIFDSARQRLSYINSLSIAAKAIISQWVRNPARYLVIKSLRNHGHILFVTIYSTAWMISSQHAYLSGVISTVDTNTLFIFCCLLCLRSRLHRLSMTSSRVEYPPLPCSNDRLSS